MWKLAFCWCGQQPTCAIYIEIGSKMPVNNGQILQYFVQIAK